MYKYSSGRYVTPLNSNFKTYTSINMQQNKLTAIVDPFLPIPPVKMSLKLARAIIKVTAIAVNNGIVTNWHSNNGS